MFQNPYTPSFSVGFKLWLRAGVQRQFEAQGRTALRLAHFLSNFMQNVDEYEEFGDLKGDRRLNETQLFGEVIANVMGDFRSALYCS